MSDLRVAAEFWAAYEAAGRNAAELSRRTGIPVTTVKEIRGFHQSGRVWDGANWVSPEKKQPISVADKLLQDHRRMADRLLTHEAARTEIILRHMTNCIDAFPPVKIAPPKFQGGKKRSPMGMVVLLSDWQYGEVVDPAQVMDLNAYDCEIAARRVHHLEKLVLTGLDIIGRAHPVPTLYLPVLGDMVSGTIHDLAETNDGNIYEQFYGVTVLMAQFIMRLAPNFERIVLTGVPGNHGRMTERKRSKDAYVNWDWIAYQVLELMLANQTNIECDFPRSVFTLGNIEGHEFLFTHGGDIKSWAGIPMYGIQRSVAKLSELLQSARKSFDYAVFAHFHEGLEKDRAVGEIIVNPSLVGGGEYAINGLLTSSPPRQRIFFMHEEHGKTWELGNDLRKGDRHPHPYTIQKGASLADAYRAVMKGR